MSKTLVVDKPCYDTSDTFESHVEDDNDTALDRAVNQFRSKEKESARAELAHLRARAAEAERLQAVVAARAVQLEQARPIIEDAMNDYLASEREDSADKMNRCNDWLNSLAANAPEAEATR